MDRRDLILDLHPYSETIDTQCPPPPGLRLSGLLSSVFLPVFFLRGTLEVRLMGCQDLLEDVPGRCKTLSASHPGWSPSEQRSSFMSRSNKNKGASSRNLSKTDDLSS